MLCDLVLPCRDEAAALPDLMARLPAGLTVDAILGSAEDGGWWVLALRNPTAAEVLARVEMSTPTTCADTMEAPRAAGLDVGTTASLRDVDEVLDAAGVAGLVPRSRCGAAWRAA